MPVCFLLIVAVFSAIIMLLWNWLMPSLFGLITINFWQAAGLFIFARILFGGFGLGKHKMMHSLRHKNPMHEKWMKMTPEQRMDFINKRRKLGFGGPFGRNDFFGECCKADENKEPENKDE